MSASKTGTLHAGWPLNPAPRQQSAPPFSVSLLKESSTLPIPPPAGGPARRRARRKLWDVPIRLHCPLIGTCLEAESLRALAGKLERRAGCGDSDYELHVRFVAAAGSKNPASIAVQKLLEKQHAETLRRTARIRCRDDLARAWNDALDAGDVPGAMWATLTHPLCDDAIRTRIFEDIHMLSHQLGAGQRADLCQYARARDELIRLRRRFDTLNDKSRRQIDTRDRRIQSLEAALEASEQARRLGEHTRAGLQRELDTLHSNDDATRAAERARALIASERRLQSMTRERDEWKDACHEERSRLDALRSRFDTLVAEYDALERIVAERLGGNDPDDECHAESTDLGGRQVLYVGGRNQLVDRYRALVERCNGQFSHHDGGRENSRARLESMMSSVDAVFCATDCVSHDACLRLKRFCKRHRKHYIMLQSSGLSSLARAIESLPCQARESGLLHSTPTSDR